MPAQVDVAAVLSDCESAQTKEQLMLALSPFHNSDGDLDKILEGGLSAHSVLRQAGMTRCHDRKTIIRAVHETVGAEAKTSIEELQERVKVLEQMLDVQEESDSAGDVPKHHMFMGVAVHAAMRRGPAEMTLTEDVAAVGCAIRQSRDVGEPVVISVGWNGYNPGIPENQRQKVISCLVDVGRKQEKGFGKELLFHAEFNAISYARYSNGSLEGASLYVTVEPCFKCCTVIVASGISKVFYLHPLPNNDKTNQVLLKAGGVGLFLLPDHDAFLEAFSDKTLKFIKPPPGNPPTKPPQFSAASKKVRKSRRSPRYPQSKKNGTL